MRAKDSEVHDRSTREDRSPVERGRRILLVDDDESVARVLRRVLSSSGYDVTCAGNGETARELLAASVFDVIVSDISMPGIGGIELLRLVRERDPDVPVVMMTGDPHVETAIEAVHYGALDYLVKPVKPPEIRRVVDHAVRLHALARIKRQGLELVAERARAASDRAALEADFHQALDSLYIAYQPIVLWPRREAFGYEALLRTRHETLGHPVAVLDAAQSLGRVHDLGRRVRSRAARAVPLLDRTQSLFVNLHPLELTDDELYSPKAPLALHAARVVLEITERASLPELSDTAERLEALRSLGFRLALDDLGAAYADLDTFVHLKPEIVKIDMMLVRDVDRNRSKRAVIQSILDLCDEMGIEAVAEGVETAEERRALVGLGATLLQGYLFGYPSETLSSPPPDSMKD